MSDWQAPTPRERVGVDYQHSDYWGYVFGITVVPTTANLVLDDPVPIRDAYDECAHGRLQGDRTEPCGCFRVERSGALASPRKI